MKDFEHLMSVWQDQPKHDVLSVDDVLKQVKKDVKIITKQLYWGIVAMVSLLVVTFLVMFFFVFISILTYAGILIMLVTMLLYTSLIIRHYRILHKRDATINPTEYLVSLREYQKDRTKLAGWFYYIFVLLISIGLSMYLFEVLGKASIYFKTATYTITVVWFLFCTFYLKRRIFMSEEEKLNLMIDRLERLKLQFE